MSNEKEAKPSNKDRAIERIQAAVGKYKILKVPALLNDVVKHVFGDLKDEEEKADKAFTLVRNLLNELVENGTLSQFTFVSMTKEAGSDTPSIINESIIVQGGFQLAGYVPASFESELAETVDEEDDVFSTSDDVNDMISDNAVGYAVVNATSTGRTIDIKDSPQAALGKYLELVAHDTNEPEIFALLPVELTITSMLGQPVVLKVTEDESEPISG